MAQGPLDQRLGEAAVGEVVGGGEQPDGVVQQHGQPLLGRQVDLRRQPAEVTVHDVGPLRAGELLTGLAEEEDAVRHRPSRPTAYDG